MKTRNEVYKYSWYIHAYSVALNDYVDIYYPNEYYRSLKDCKEAVEEYLQINSHIKENCEVVFQEWDIPSDVYEETECWNYEHGKIVKQ